VDLHFTLDPALIHQQDHSIKNDPQSPPIRTADGSTLMAISLEGHRRSSSGSVPTVQTNRGLSSGVGLTVPMDTDSSQSACFVIPASQNSSILLNSVQRQSGLSMSGLINGSFSTDGIPMQRISGGSPASGSGGVVGGLSSTPVSEVSVPQTKSIQTIVLPAATQAISLQQNSTISPIIEDPRVSRRIFVLIKFFF